MSKSSTLFMNTKHFVKVAEDKKSTTLRHKAGHEMKISHNSLNPETRAQLKKLPMYNDATVKKFADGGEVDQASQPEESLGQKIAEGAKSLWNNGYSDTPPPSASPLPSPVANSSLQSPSVEPMGDAENADLPQAPQPTPDQMMNAEASQQAQATDQAAQPQPKAAPPAPTAATPPPVDTSNSMVNPGDYQGTFNSGAQEAMSGIQHEAMAQGELGKKQAIDRDQYIRAQQGALGEFQKHYHAIDQDVQHVMEDIKNTHIDPAHYMASKGAFGKMKIGIGMILGGMSAGTLGGPNPAVTMLNQQIDRDIDAQKANLGKQESLLSANYKRFGNLRDATDMTRIMSTNILANKIQSDAEKSQSPLALANAQKAIGQLKMQIAPQQAQFAMRQMMMGDSAAPKTEAAFVGKLHALQMLAPDMYKDYQSKYIPGEGVAEKIPPAESLKAIEKFNSFNTLLGHAIDLQKKMGNTGAWSAQNRAQAQSLQSAITTQMNDLTGLNRLTSEEVHFYSKAIGDIGSVNSGTVLAKLQNIQQQLKDHKSTMLKSLNVQPFQKSDQNAVALQWAQQNPHDPRSAAIIQRLQGK